MLLLVVFSESRQKVPSFKLKIPSPTKKPSNTMPKPDSRKTFIESGGDGTSNTLGEKSSGEPRLKSYPHVEWTLIYTQDEGDLLLIFAKSEGEGKLQVGKTFTYGHVKNIEYEDNDSSNLLFDVDSSVGMRRVRIDEQNFVTDSCHPKALKKDVQTKNNLIVALRPYIKGELMVAQATTPPKSANKSKPEHKKYKKRQQPEDDEPEVLKFVEDE